jgi:hypothetical protein
MNADFEHSSASIRDHLRFKKRCPFSVLRPCVVRLLQALDDLQHSSTKLPKTKPGQSSQSNIAQHRSLTIKLTNTSNDSIDGVVVKYFFIGRDMKDQKLKVLQHGERTASLAPRKTEAVESEDAVNTYTEAHSEVSKSKGGARSNLRGGTKVTKVLGYAVQAFIGNKLEAEQYSEQSYKKVVGESTPGLSQQPAEKKKVPPKKSPKKK